MSLELALATPALFLLLLLVLYAAVHGLDALLVQAAAREGARVAATTRADAAVRVAVRAALDGRDAHVTVRPAGRGPGDLVRVEVRLRPRTGRGGDLVASAVAVVEPVLEDP